MAAAPNGAPGAVIFGSVSSEPTPTEPPQVLVGDCRTGLSSLPDKTASLVLTDPPYFIDGMGDEWNATTIKQRITSNVVGGVPAGQKYDRSQGERLQEFLYPIAQDLLRVLRPGGFFLCFSMPRLVHHTAMAIERAGFEVRDLLAWTYQGQPKAATQAHRVRQYHLPLEDEQELLGELAGRKTAQLKPQIEPIVLAQAPTEGTLVENWQKYATGLVDLSDPWIEPGKFPGQLIPCPKPKQRHGHITPKPVDVCRHLVRIFCTQSGLVLDPFCGSGATGVAAVLEDRRFKGWERDPAMAEVAAARLEDAWRDQQS